MVIGEKDLVIQTLKDAEKVQRDLANTIDGKATQARNDVKTHERDAAEARARADKFKAAITKLGA